MARVSTGVRVAAVRLGKDHTARRHAHIFWMALLLGLLGRPAFGASLSGYAPGDLTTGFMRADGVLRGDDHNRSRAHVYAIEQTLYKAVQAHDGSKGDVAADRFIKDDKAAAAWELSQLALLEGEPATAIHYLNLARADGGPETDETLNWRATIVAVSGRLDEAVRIMDSKAPPRPCIGSGLCAAEASPTGCRAAAIDSFDDTDWSGMLAATGPSGACASAALTSVAGFFSNDARDDLAEQFLKAAILAASREKTDLDEAAEAGNHARWSLVALLCEQGRVNEARIYLRGVQIIERDEASQAYVLMAQQSVDQFDKGLSYYAGAEIASDTTTLQQVASQHPDYDFPVAVIPDIERIQITSAYRERSVANFALEHYEAALHDSNGALKFGVAQDSAGWPLRMDFGPQGPTCPPGRPDYDVACRKWVSDSISASADPRVSRDMAYRAAIEAKLGHDAEALAVGGFSHVILRKWLDESWANPREVAATLRARRTADEWHLDALRSIYAKDGANATEALFQAFETIQLLQYSDAETVLRSSLAVRAVSDLNLRDLVQQRMALAEARAVAARVRPRDVAGLDAQLASLDLKLPMSLTDLDKRTEFQPVSIPDVRALLHDDEAMLVVATVAGHTDAIVLTKSAAIWVSASVGEDWIGQRLRRLLPYLRGGSASGATFDAQAAGELYHAILEPAASAIGDRLILSSVSGPLAQLPLGVLPVTGITQPQGMRWLAQSNPILVLPSASSLALVRSARPAKARSALIAFGDPLISADEKSRFAQDGLELPPLTEAGTEIDRLKQALAQGGTVTVLTKEHFTKDAIMRADLTNVRVIEFATHALSASDTRLVTEPALLLSPTTNGSVSDLFLTGSDIVGLHIDADLVLLSACNSAVGPDDGNSLAGLARSFLFAGARGIVASKWPVDDDAAKRLIGAGVTPDAVSPIAFARHLQKEIGTLIDAPEKGPSTDPRFWGPFIVVGG